MQGAGPVFEPELNSQNINSVAVSYLSRGGADAGGGKLLRVVISIVHKTTNLLIVNMILSDEIDNTLRQCDR